MSFRFWRRIRIAPGVTLNLSKGGGSVSLGPRGAKMTRGLRGDRATVGIPGTGLFYTAKLPRDKTSRMRSAAPADAVQPKDRLTLGFFKRLVTPADEKALVDGCRELALGDEKLAGDLLSRAVHLADGAYLAGFLALRQDRLEEAARYLSAAAEKSDHLGRYFAKYGISATMNLSVTNELSAKVGPDLQGVLLGLVEVQQRRKQWQDAIGTLERLRRLAPDDVLLKLSLAELLWDADPGDKKTCRTIVRLAEDVENDTEVHAALLLYKARALRALGLIDASRDLLTRVLRRRKGRPDVLLLALRYDRALIYEGQGQVKRARKDFEMIYAEDPDYEDVAIRLGL